MIGYNWGNEIMSPGAAINSPGMSHQEVIPMTAPKSTLTPKQKQTDIERLMQRVVIDPSSGCWQWQGPTNYGYGRFYSRGVTYRAHRAAYELLVGPVPIGLEMHHLCHNRACVNPSHLQPIERHDHWLLGTSVSLFNATKETCVNGHPFTEENTHIYEKAGRKVRHCRACGRERVRKQAASRRNPIDARKKLTEEQCAAAASDYQSGASLRVLAQRMGVNSNTILYHLQRLGIPRRTPGRHATPRLHDDTIPDTWRCTCCHRTQADGARACVYKGGIRQSRCLSCRAEIARERYHQRKEPVRR